MAGEDGDTGVRHMIELVEGFWVDADDIKVIKRIDDNKCAIWVTGQSATDGFVLDYPAESILETLGFSAEDVDDAEELEGEEGDGNDD